MATVGVAADTGKAAYEHALWFGDLLAAVREEAFAGPPVGAGDGSGSRNSG